MGTLQEEVVGILVDTEVVDTFYFLEKWVVLFVLEVVDVVALLRELGSAGVSLFQPFLVS